MKKAHRWVAVCALTMSALNGSAKATTIASDVSPFPVTSHPDAQAFALSSSPISNPALAVNVPGDAVQTRPDEKFNLSINATLPVARPHADSHLDLWLILIAAIVAGGLSEILHRRSHH
jgi:hypothetical protein